MTAITLAELDAVMAGAQPARHTALKEPCRAERRIASHRGAQASASAAAVIAAAAAKRDPFNAARLAGPESVQGVADAMCTVDAMYSTAALASLASNRPDATVMELCTADRLMVLMDEVLQQCGEAEESARIIKRQAAQIARLEALLRDLAGEA